MARPKLYQGLKCKIGGCKEPAASQWMCLKHYHAVWRKKIRRPTRHPVKRDRLLRMSAAILLRLNDATAQQLGDDIRFTLRDPPYHHVKKQAEPVDKDYALFSIAGDLDEVERDG